jgi:hypothetical protein
MQGMSQPPAVRSWKAWPVHFSNHHLSDIFISDGLKGILLSCTYSPLSKPLHPSYSLIKKLNSVAFSPQANYTDRTSAACRPS